MAAKISFNIATKQGPVVKTGFVANLKIGNKTVKFVMQDDIGESCSLTHFASGFTVIHGNTVAARKLAHYMANPYSSRLTNRQACDELLAEMVNNIGAENILKKFDSVPVINT